MKVGTFTANDGLLLSRYDSMDTEDAEAVRNMEQGALSRICQKSDYY